MKRRRGRRRMTSRRIKGRSGRRRRKSWRIKGRRGRRRKKEKDEETQRSLRFTSMLAFLGFLLVYHLRKRAGNFKEFNYYKWENDLLLVIFPYLVPVK